MEQCPICFAELEVRDCAPCDDCGWDVPTEITHLHENRHTYITYEIYHGLKLTLCNFCAVDFGSYQPEYFGSKNRRQIDLASFSIVKQVEHPDIVKDKFCSTCSRRLKFLKFVAAVRQLKEVSGGR